MVRSYPRGGNPYRPGSEPFDAHCQIQMNPSPATNHDAIGSRLHRDGLPGRLQQPEGVAIHLSLAVRWTHPLAYEPGENSRCRKRQTYP